MKVTPKLVAVAVTLALSPTLFAQETLDTTKVGNESEAQQDASVKVIDAQQIDAEMIQDVYDTVRYIPGVNVNNTGNRFGDNGFNIRGMEGDAVAITIDGLSQGESLNPTTFSRYGMFSSTRNAIEPESVKSIEIIKGANSVLAGSGALGGAVMYTTKDADDFLKSSGDDFAGSFKLGFDGRSNETLSSLALAKRIGDFEGLLIVTKRDGSETKTHENGDDVEGSARGQADPMDSDKTNLLAKFGYQINQNHQIGLVFENFESARSGTPLSRESASYYSFSTFDESNRTRLGMFYDYQGNTFLFDTAALKINHQEVDTHGSTKFLYSGYLRNEDRYYDQEMESFTLDFSKDAFVSQTNHFIAYGIAIETKEVDNQLFDKRYIGETEDSGFRDGYPIVDPSWVPNTESDIWSLYVTDKVELNEQLTLQGGIRYDNVRYTPKTDDDFIDQTGNSVANAEFSALTWALNLGYEFNPNHSITASIGTGFKAPTTQQLYLNTNATSVFEDSERVVDENGSVSYVSNGRTETDLDTVTNPNLDAETATNYELAYQWQGDNGYLNFSVFRADYDDFIINLNQSRSFDEPITQASSNWWLAQCAEAVVDDSCWTVSQITEDTWGVPTNVGKVKVTGYELDVGYQLSQGLLVTLSHSHTSGEYRNSVEGSSESNVDASFSKGDELESIAPDTTVLGLNYRLPAGNWGGSVFARFIDGKDEQEYFSATFYSESAIVLDLSGFYEITDNLVIRANVTNLFNEEYTTWQRVRLVREGTGGFFGGVSDNGIQRFNEPGREFAVNLSYAF
ncbi:TonB-dependent hemoglobin/transferrin/lactoferrin family receptor [Aliiglaciecola sp. NS0011-25]|uniref:TonB-dependent hemoglobin/transferrin/lactoferrin family receptor n=1 Tax=Aliiglaciecola sp. NS0011-25 TaxID=3127654 RepID=UPI003107CBE0